MKTEKSRNWILKLKNLKTVIKIKEIKTKTLIGSDVCWSWSKNRHVNYSHVRDHHEYARTTISQQFFHIQISFLRNHCLCSFNSWCFTRFNCYETTLITKQARFFYKRFCVEFFKRQFFISRRLDSHRMNLFKKNFKAHLENLLTFLQDWDSFEIISVVFWLPKNLVKWRNIAIMSKTLSSTS